MQPLEAVDINTRPLGEILVHQGFKYTLGKLVKERGGHFGKSRFAIEGRGIDPLGELIEQEGFQRGCGIKEML